MPFKSEAQRKFLFSQHPDIAKRWAAKYGVPKNLPKHVGSGRIRRKKKRGKK